jgi:hypothetical protein
MTLRTVAGFLLSALLLTSPGFAAKNRCGTRTPTLEEQNQIELDLQSGHRKTTGTIVVPVWIHVMTQGSGYDNGDISNKTIKDQLDVLNETYAGARGGAVTGFSFNLVGVDRIVDADCFNMAPQTIEERRCKQALRRGGAETLNIYTGTAGIYLGWSYFPSGYSSQPFLDGIVIDFRSMPGGTYPGFNLGFTATHEAGHWLALYHTFQGGCTPNNDYVLDTPAERYPASGCPIGIDTCTTSKYPGLDPVQNYMDYSDDPCYTDFTDDQATRMREAWSTYRQ